MPFSDVIEAQIKEELNKALGNVPLEEKEDFANFSNALNTWVNDKSKSSIAAKKYEILYTRLNNIYNKFSKNMEDFISKAPSEDSMFKFLGKDLSREQKIQQYQSEYKKIYKKND